MNDAAVWVEPCTAVTFLKIDSRCRENHPRPLSQGGSDQGLEHVTCSTLNTSVAFNMLQRRTSPLNKVFFFSVCVVGTGFKW